MQELRLGDVIAGTGTKQDERWWIQRPLRRVRRVAGRRVPTPRRSATTGECSDARALDRLEREAMAKEAEAFATALGSTSSTPTTSPPDHGGPLETVDVTPLRPQRFAEVLTGEGFAQFEEGEAARLRVRDLFLGPRHLGQYVVLLQRVLAATEARRSPDSVSIAGA